MNTTLTSRVLAGGTVAGLLLLGAASGVFGTFSASLISGQTCTGYGYYPGYGYGYDCTPTTTTNGGGGGGSSTSVSPIITTNNSGTVIEPPAVTPTVILFPNFVPDCTNEVLNLTDSRITAFYGEIGVVNTSNPNRKLTRAEFLKLAINAAGINVSAEADPSYSDVSATHSLRKYIAYATRNGIVSGQDGKFRPDDLITRAEVAKVLVNGAKIGLASNIDAFGDVSDTNTLAPYIQAAFDNCILHGRQTWNGTPPADAARMFEPNDGITLAESAKVLFNVSKL